MEIKEIFTFYINESTKTLDVTFRTINDSEDEIRTSQIEFDEIDEFGFSNIISINDDFEDFDDDFESDELSEFDFFGNDFESDITSFLNEYYLVNPNKLPKPEFF